MTFLEMQTALLERFDATDATDTADAKVWLNTFGATLYVLENWTFRQATASLTTSVGSADVTGEPADIGNVRRIFNSSGDVLTPLSVDDYFDTYQATIALAQTGLPEAYTVIGGQVKLGPPSSEAKTYTLLYRKRYTDLSANGDISALPVSFHWLQVAGALAVGQAHRQDPTGALQEPVVARGVAAMQREYLSELEAVEQWGRLP